MQAQPWEKQRARLPLGHQYHKEGSDLWTGALHLMEVSWEATKLVTGA